MRTGVTVDTSSITLHQNGKKNRELVIDYNKLKRAVYLLRSLDHKIRKGIIRLLSENDFLTVTEIYVQLRVEQSVASQHLAILRKAEIVKTDRNGKFIHYSLNQDRLTEILEWIDALEK